MPPSEPSDYASAAPPAATPTRPTAPPVLIEYADKHAPIQDISGDAAYGAEPPGAALPVLKSSSFVTAPSAAHARPPEPGVTSPGRLRAPQPPPGAQPAGAGSHRPARISTASPNGGASNQDVFNSLQELNNRMDALLRKAEEHQQKQQLASARGAAAAAATHTASSSSAGAGSGHHSTSDADAAQPSDIATMTRKTSTTMSQIQAAMATALADHKAKYGTSAAPAPGSASSLAAGLSSFRSRPAGLVLGAEDADTLIQPPTYDFAVANGALNGSAHSHGHSGSSLAPPPALTVNPSLSMSPSSAQTTAMATRLASEAVELDRLGAARRSEIESLRAQLASFNKPAAAGGGPASARRPGPGSTAAQLSLVSSPRPAGSLPGSYSGGEGPASPTNAALGSGFVTPTHGRKLSAAATTADLLTHRAQIEAEIEASRRSRAQLRGVDPASVPPVAVAPLNSSSSSSSAAASSTSASGATANGGDSLDALLASVSNKPGRVRLAPSAAAAASASGSGVSADSLAGGSGVSDSGHKRRVSTLSGAGSSMVSRSSDLASPTASAATQHAALLAPSVPLSAPEGRPIATPSALREDESTLDDELKRAAARVAALEKAAAEARARKQKKKDRAARAAIDEDGDTAFA